MIRQKFAHAMNRFPILAGALTLMVGLPSLALGAPTGGAVYRAAPVVVRPAFPQRTGEQNHGDFKVPFHVDAAPKMREPEMRFPTFQAFSRRGWTWQPNYVFLSSPCFANGANWAAPQQNLAAGESTMSDVKIGSLAGNPKHSILSTSGADIAHLASTSNASLDSSSGTGLKFEWQPSVCQSGLGF